MLPSSPRGFLPTRRPQAPSPLGPPGSPRVTGKASPDDGWARFSRPTEPSSVARSLRADPVIVLRLYCKATPLSDTHRRGEVGDGVAAKTVVRWGKSGFRGGSLAAAAGVKKRRYGIL